MFPSNSGVKTKKRGLHPKLRPMDTGRLLLFGPQFSLGKARSKAGEA